MLTDQTAGVAGQTDTRIGVIVARIRRGDTRQAIADDLGLSVSTIRRDELQARELGLLPPAPPPLPKPARAGKPNPRTPRKDLAKSWRTAVDELARRARSLEDMTFDDRYVRRRRDLLRSRGDLMHAAKVIAEILDDFEADLATDQTPGGNHDRHYHPQDFTRQESNGV